MKSYREVLLNRVPAGQRRTRDLVFFHGVHTLSALIRKLEGVQPPQRPSDPPVAQKPVISVSTEGSGETSVFIVTGSRFLGGTSVAIRIGRIGEGQVHNVFVRTTATTQGTIQMQIPIPCVTGLELSFSANDGRRDPSDLTGTLWSNTVQARCP